MLRLSHLDPNFIAKCAQIASALEVSGHPKPGNVHRTQDFPDMIFEDFLISGIVSGETMKHAAIRGSNFGEKPEKWHKIGLGELILEAVLETDRWVANNTNLGIMMLLIPISAAAGMSEEIEELRSKLDQIMKSTTPQDAANLYKAINIANAGGMGEQDDLDVSDDASVHKLIENGINMYNVLEMSSEWDCLSYELTHGMPVTFQTGFPIFKDIQEKYNTNQATVQTFLNILAQNPDTLIRRKYGEDKAQVVSAIAKSVLHRGGILTQEGISKLVEFDQQLIQNKLNPGTTADLTASSIMVAYLDHYRDYKNNDKK
jgi:triphosphoribosyl-dephospho-CoA synthase